MAAVSAISAACYCRYLVDCCLPPPLPLFPSLLSVPTIAARHDRHFRNYHCCFLKDSYLSNILNITAEKDLTGGRGSPRRQRHRHRCHHIGSCLLCRRSGCHHRCHQADSKARNCTYHQPIWPLCCKGLLGVQVQFGLLPKNHTINSLYLNFQT